MQMNIIINDYIINKPSMQWLINILVQAVRGFSLHFWKKFPFFAQMISNMYYFDPDIAILTRLTPN